MKSETTKTPEQPAATPSASPSPEATATPEATPEATPTPSSTPNPSATPTPPTPAPTPEPTPEQKAERKESGGVCALTLSEEALTFKSNGGSATLTITLENYAGPTPPRVNASTENWADIIVLAEPHAPADGNALRFTITSVSTKTGIFNVTFSSPCGKRQVAVNVR